MDFSRNKKATLTDGDTLGQLLDMELESAGVQDSDAQLTSEIRQAAKAYDAAVLKAAKEWVEKNMDKMALGEGDLRHAQDADDVVNVMEDLGGGAGYLYFMEAEGHGVGTWDGRWDPLFVDDRKSLKEMSTHVKQKTRQDYNKLKNALVDAADEAASESDESDREASQVPVRLAMAIRVAVRFATENVEALTFPRDFHLPAHLKQEKPLVPDGTDLAVWTWEEERGGKSIPMGIAFQGKSNKPLWYYRFNSPQDREQRIKETADSRRQVLKMKQDDAEDRRNFQHGLQVGSILYTSWGYDQTNVNFYEVTEVKGKMVILREIAQRLARDTGAGEYVVAVPGHYTSQAFSRRPGKSGNEAYIRIDSTQIAHPWNGKPQYQTGAGAGH